MIKYITISILFILFNLTAHAQPWIQLGKNINGEAKGDNSGWSVSLSSDGTTVAIGAPENDVEGKKIKQDM